MTESASKELNTRPTSAHVVANEVRVLLRAAFGAEPGLETLAKAALMHLSRLQTRSYARPLSWLVAQPEADPQLW